MPTRRVAVLSALVFFGVLAIVSCSAYEARETLFGSTEEWTDPSGAVAWIRATGKLRGPAAGASLVGGRAHACPIPALDLVFSRDGRTAFADTEAGVFDLETCARFGSAAAYIGNDRVWVDGMRVLRAGRGIAEAVDPRLMPARDGVAISVGEGKARQWLGMLGEVGIVKFAPEDLEAQQASELMPRRGGICVRQRMGSPLLGNRIGPRARSYRCWRFRDGRRFIFGGFPVDVDLELREDQFIDVETGRDVGFPDWGGEGIPYVDPWCVTPLIVYPDGRVRFPSGCA